MCLAVTSKLGNKVEDEGGGGRGPRPEIDRILFSDLTDRTT